VRDGTGASCIGTLASGVGSCAIQSTSAGTKTLTATYGGDPNFSLSISSGATHVVNAATTFSAISVCATLFGACLDGPATRPGAVADTAPQVAADAAAHPELPPEPTEYYLAGYEECGAFCDHRAACLEAICPAPAEDRYACMTDCLVSGKTKSSAAAYIDLLGLSADLSIWRDACNKMRVVQRG